MLSETDQIGRVARWLDWHGRSHLKVLTAAVRSFQGLGHSIEQVLAELSRGQQRPWPGRVQQAVKRNFQRCVCQKLLSSERPSPEMRIRNKLERWRFTGIPRHLTRRILALWEELRSLVPPRVSVACFSTLWNRWTTARRFQQRGSNCRCVLGCDGEAEDSIEHYACCAAVRHVASRFLCLEPLLGLPEFLLTDQGHIDKDTLTCRAVLVYAAFMATNYFRAQGPATFDIATDALEQHCMNAASGHPACAKVLDSRWVDVSAESGAPLRRRQRGAPGAGAGARARTPTRTKMVSGGMLVTGADWQSA